MKNCGYGKMYFVQKIETQNVVKHNETEANFCKMFYERNIIYSFFCPLSVKTEEKCLYIENS